HIYQLFMRDFHEEQAVLYSLAKIIKNEGLIGLITYNGKCYDTTILNSRSITSGIELPISNMPNFDLLFPVRSIFKPRIGDCSLPSVEREVLNFYRVDDIPGYKVPEIYFDFVRRGFSEPMRKVFIHNLYDVLSMAAIAEKLCSIYSDPFDCPAELADLFQVASLYKKNGDFEKAMKIYQYLSSLDCSLNFQANLALSFELKREGEYKEASKIWEKCIVKQPKSSIVPYIELAKFNEHHLKDYKKALEYARNGRAVANLLKSQSYDNEDFDKRIRRLENKPAKAKRNENMNSSG
ncbi:ribonuclease H-like domain-containing protein, partial [bacterium]|nr:ribonuclease H-like domain-containing protein [bacterium]